MKGGEKAVEMSELEIQQGRTCQSQCRCGKEWHRPGAKYCYNCGARLDKKVRSTTSERNLNWAALAIPEDCRSIFLCMDGDLFDERRKQGMVSLYDDREQSEKTAIPCFLGYMPTADLTHLDTLAGLPSAKQEQEQLPDRCSHEAS